MDTYEGADACGKPVHTMIQTRSNVLPRLALALCVGISGCDAWISADARMSRASTALEEGQLESAMSDARILAERHPERVDAWLLLARIGLQAGDVQGALRDLERAAAGGAEAGTIRPLRDQVLLKAGNFEELVAQDARTPDEMVAKAAALAGLGRYEEADQLVKSVLAVEPRHAGSRLLQVRMLHGQGQASEARTALDALLNDEPTMVEGWLLKAHYALADSAPDVALDALALAAPGAAKQLTLPEQAGLFATMAETQLNVGQTDEAARSLSRLRALIPQSPVTEYLSARIAMAQGDVTTAVAILQRSLQEDPKHAPSRLLLGAALLEQGSVEQARSQLNALVAEQPENMGARKLLAQLYFAQGDSVAAERILSELPDGVKADPTADWMRSAILSMSGQSAESLAVLEQAAQLSPGHVPLQLDLARAYLSVGRREEAVRVLDSISGQPLGWAGKQLHVLARIQDQPRESMPGLLRQIAAESPQDPELRCVIGQFQLQLGDAAAAAEQFRAALSIAPQQVEARLGLAGVALQTADYAVAEAELRRAIAANPRTEKAYLALAAVAVRQARFQEGREWLERLITTIPESAAGRMALAELSYRDKQPEQAAALLQQAGIVAQDKQSALRQAGDIHMRAGEAAKAEPLYAQAYEQRPSGSLAVRLYASRRDLRQEAPEAVLRQWLQGHPQDVSVRAVLAEHLLGQNDLREAIAEYERLLQQGSSPAMLNNLAWAYQLTGDERAEATARRALEGAPTNPAIAHTYGWILLENGKVEQALPLLEKAALALPDNAEVQGHVRRARAIAGGG